MPKAFAIFRRIIGFGIKLDMLSNGKSLLKKNSFCRTSFLCSPCIPVTFEKVSMPPKIISPIQITKNARNTKIDFLNKIERNIKKQKKENSLMK